MNPNTLCIYIIFGISLIIFTTWFVKGYRLLKDYEPIGKISFEEKYISIALKTENELYEHSSFRVSWVLVDEKYLIIKSNFLWAHYLNKNNLLLKIPFKQINKISKENGVMVAFNNENNNQQILRIQSNESERLVETLSQQINHEQ